MDTKYFVEPAQFWLWLHCVNALGWDEHSVSRFFYHGCDQNFQVMVDTVISMTMMGRCNVDEISLLAPLFMFPTILHLGSRLWRLLSCDDNARGVVRVLRDLGYTAHSSVRIEMQIGSDELSTDQFSILTPHSFVQRWNFHQVIMLELGDKTYIYDPVLQIGPCSIAHYGMFFSTLLVPETDDEGLVMEDHVMYIIDYHPIATNRQLDAVRLCRAGTYY